MEQTQWAVGGGATREGGLGRVVLSEAEALEAAGLEE